MLPQSPIPNPRRLIPPGATIGILGGGQLGRMLAIAATELGYRVHIYCPEADCPAGMVAAQTTVAGYDDAAALRDFAAGVDVITYEFENIPHAPVAFIAAITPVYPDPELLAVSQHRVQEKRAINALGIATAPFMPVDSLESLQAAAAQLGLPAVLKTTRMGYDGKGQCLLNTEDELAAAWQQLRHPEQREGSQHAAPDPSAAPQDDDAPFILEGFVNFRMEISVIIARDAQGNMECYCPVQNIHQHHILAQTIAPAPVSAALAGEAQQIARRIAAGWGLVGVMAVELFVTERDSLLVNETAPRPHNSGHWTIDACISSQFEQTIRAICGLPLGSVERLCDARMLNLIGDDIHNWPRYAAQPNAKLHLYGKKEVRPGRKMGHVTLLERPKAT